MKVNITLDMSKTVKTHAQQRKNKNHAVNFLVKYRPHIPRSPRFHSFHFCALRSAASSRFAAFVIPRSSSFFHSGPRAGTVTISTGAPPKVGVSSTFTSEVGELTLRYLQ